MSAAGPAVDILERLFQLIVWTSIEGGLVVLGVWLVCALAPAMPPRLRAGIWWMACARFAVGLVWTQPLLLPVLPPAAHVPREQVAAIDVVQPIDSPAKADPGAPGDPALPARVTSAGAGGAPTSEPALPPVAMAGSAAAWIGSWRSGEAFASMRPVGSVLAALWLAGVLILAGRVIREVIRHRRLVGGATAVDPESLPMVADAGRRLGFDRLPRMVAATGVRSPLVVWAGRTVVVLPGAPGGGLSQYEMALAAGHELVHVRRRDLWWGSIAALSERLFFFHPLARLAAREYLTHREAACDAEVVGAD